MQFKILGFTQHAGFRVFAFEGVRLDQSKSAFTVRTDLALTRKHGIQVQELPLLCRGMLERKLDGEQPSSLVFAEEDMHIHEQSCKEARRAALQKRKTPRRHAPHPEQTGLCWRGTANVKALPDGSEMLGGL